MKTIQLLEHASEPHIHILNIRRSFEMLKKGQLRLLVDELQKLGEILTKETLLYVYRSGFDKSEFGVVSSLVVGILAEKVARIGVNIWGWCRCSDCTDEVAFVVVHDLAGERVGEEVRVNFRKFPGVNSEMSH